jgi:hypothetical protein
VPVIKVPIEESLKIEPSAELSSEPEYAEDSEQYEETEPDEVSLVKEVFQADTPRETVGDIATAWPQFLDILMKDRPNLGSFLALGYIASATPQTIDLRFASSYRFQYAEVTKKNQREEVEKMLHSHFGAPVELRITLETAKTEAGQNYIKQFSNVAPTINDEIDKEPIIQSVLDVFDGEVVG